MKSRAWLALLRGFCWVLGFYRKDDVMETLRQKFTSGNNVLVTSARIDRAEYVEILKIIAIAKSHAP